LCAKGHKPIKIYLQLCEVYGKKVITEGGVRQWCIRFKDGRTNVHDEGNSGRPSIVTDELVENVNAKVHENREQVKIDSDQQPVKYADQIQELIKSNFDKYTTPTSASVLINCLDCLQKIKSIAPREIKII